MIEKMEDLARSRDEANRLVMAERMASALPKDGYVDVLPGVRLMRRSKSSEEVYGDSNPAFCVVAQGAKDVYVGGAKYHYDESHYLLATLEMPITSVILEASEDRPFLSLRFDIDPVLVGSVMVESGIGGPASHHHAKAIGVSPLDSGLLDASARLLRLADSPGDVRTLLPLVQREIVYRLLTGDQGHRLKNLPDPNGHTSRIARALERIRRDFDKPLSIEELAHEMGMSSTRFHHHFKAVTDMSPLQFQKKLRLQEARRMMLSGDLDVAGAGFHVGYEDAAHFNRDYKKHYGQSPGRDVERLRTLVGAK